MIEAPTPERERPRRPRQLIVSASLLFLVILAPIGAQDPVSPQPPSWQNKRRFYTPVAPARPGRNDTLSPSIPARPPITDSPATPNDEIVLKVSPESVEVGNEVSFEVSFTPPPRVNLDYRFVFGEGEPVVTPNRQTTHTYASGGQYHVSVEIRLIRPDGPSTLKTLSRDIEVKPKALAQSPTVTPAPTYSPPSIPTVAPTVAPSIAPPPSITPSSELAPPRPPSIPWNYVIPIAFVVAITGYLLHRKPKLKGTAARPTFHPHWDQGTPQKQQENVSINYELHFDPNLSKGRHRLDTGGTSLIKSRKKKP